MPINMSKPKRFCGSYFMVIKRNVFKVAENKRKYYLSLSYNKTKNTSLFIHSRMIFVTKTKKPRSIKQMTLVLICTGRS